MTKSISFPQGPTTLTEFEGREDKTPGTLGRTQMAFLLMPHIVTHKFVPLLKGFVRGKFSTAVDVPANVPHC